MRVTFEHSLLKRFSLVLALIAAVTAANHLALNRAIEDGRRLTHTHAVLEQVERVASLLKDAETGQRGYLLVGRDDYLKPYHAAIGSIGPEMDRLGMLTRDDPRQQERIVALRALSAREAGPPEGDDRGAPLGGTPHRPDPGPDRPGHAADG